MIKLFIFLLTLTIAAIVAAWFVENDGSILVVWMGYRIQTSVAFAILASGIVFILLFSILQILIYLKNIPKNYKKSATGKKREKGFVALSKGFIAIAAGDGKQAKKLSKQAVGYLGQAPATRLLEAQSAQLEGNSAEAEIHYNAMLENKETEIIAIKGLLIQAEKNEDLKKAIFLAEKAIKIQPDSTWANPVLLRLYKITKRWEEAKNLLHKNAKLKLIDEKQAKREGAIICIAQSHEQENLGNTEKALEFAQIAFKELPDFAPVAIVFSKLLLASDKKRKAIKILENVWKENPNPQIAKLYMEIFASESPEKRQKHADKLLGLNPNDINSHIVVADTAISADNPAKARSHLKTALAMRETSLICQMMADVERLEGTGRDAIDKWLKRSQMCNAEPVWSCTKCGASQNIWDTNCDNCQSFDSLKWSEHKSKVDVFNDGTKAIVSY